MLHRLPVRSGFFALFVLTAGLLFLFIAGQAYAQQGESDLSVNIEVMDDIHVLNSAGSFDPPPNTVYAGDELVYRVWAYNSGPDPATNVTVTVTLPGNVAPSGGTVSKYLASSSPFCNLTSSDPDVVECEVGDMDRYESLEFEIKTRVVSDAVADQADGTISTVAAVSIASSEVDPNLDNNLDSADWFVQDLADLRVVKVSSPDTEVLAGSQFTYTILIDNLGPSAARNIVITDTLITQGTVRANGCSLSIRTEGGGISAFNCNFAASRGVFDLATMGANWLNPRSPWDEGRIVITLNATANEGGDVSNLVTVTSRTPDPVASNNVSLDFLSILDTSDLELSKASDPDPVLAGEQLAYTLTVTNNGPSRADNVVVEDVLPIEVDILSVSSSSGSCGAGVPANPVNPTVCSFGSVPSGESRTMFVVVQVKPDAVTDPLTNERIIHNDAWVSSDAFDPDISNNLDTESTSIRAQADLEVGKFAEGPFPWVAGEDRTYLINIWNNGPSRAQHVEVIDQLPLNVEFLRAYIEFEAAPGGVPLPCSLTSDNTLVCPLGDLMPSPNPSFPPAARLFVDVRINPDVPHSSSITNVADLLTDTPDPDGSDNRATQEQTIAIEADLEIEKWSEPEKVYAGEQQKYTISVRNIGPSDAQDVTVTEVLPPEVAYEIDTDSCVLTGTDPQTGGQILTCAGGNLGPGETWQFDVWVLVDPAAVPGTTIINTAEVQSTTGGGDPDGNNNVATSKNLVLGKADLRINKFGKPDGEVRAGENLTYTIVVENLGPGYAHSVVITDLIQSSGSFELVSVDSDRPAACDPTSGAFSEQLQLRCALTGDLEVLAPSASGRWIVTVVVRADEAQDINNLATVVGADFDPDMDNNQAIVEHAFTDVADLTILKTAEGQVMSAGGTVNVQPDAVTAGLDVTYTLTISNHGPSTAENVVVYDLVADWLEVQSASPSQGSCDTGEGGKVTCALGSLAPDAGATVVIRATVAAWMPGGSQLKNDAQVVSDVFDADNSNNLASNSSAVSAWADLSVEKVQEPAVVLPGGKIGYTVVVANAGPSDAAFALVRDQVPEGVTNVAWECVAIGEATCPAVGTGDIYHTIGLPAGWQVMYILTGQRDAETVNWVITNTASVTTTAGQSDPDPANNEASVANRPFRQYLPAIRAARGYPDAPDLRIEDLTATSSQVEVVVKNHGSQDVTSPFWVDVYLDPAEAPSAAGQTWPEVAFRGLAWGVPIEALPLKTGESFTLTVDGPYLYPALSEVNWPLAAGTEVYAQVDSFGSPPYATVTENHELAGALYNNIAGPVLSKEDGGSPPAVNENPPAGIGLPGRP